MYKYFLIPLLAFALSSCTVYTEKRSEALSQSVFAAKDSVDLNRFDLAETYTDQASRLAFPPKHRIKILPIYTVTQEKNNAVKNLTGNNSQKAEEKVQENVLPRKPRLVVSEKKREAAENILVENSEEWKELMKLKEFSEQREIDYANLEKLKLDVDKEIIKQEGMRNQMVNDLNTLQKRLLEKELALWNRNALIIFLLVVMAAATYLRIKGIL